LRYYGSLQAILTVAAHLGHAENGNQIEAGRLHAVLVSCRTGREILREQAARRRLKSVMMQVEVRLQMLQPSFNIKNIAAKRRNKGNSCLQIRDTFLERCGRVAASKNANGATGDRKPR
jgi:hypothetical protein